MGCAISSAARHVAEPAKPDPMEHSPAQAPAATDELTDALDAYDAANARLQGLAGIVGSTRRESEPPMPDVDRSSLASEVRLNNRQPLLDARQEESQAGDGLLVDSSKGADQYRPQGVQRPRGLTRFGY
jgi:hypothetical protein